MKKARGIFSLHKEKTDYKFQITYTFPVPEYIKNEIKSELENSLAGRK